MQSKNPGMANEQPVLVRPSRDSDVEAMLSIYRRHIRGGIEEGVDDSGADVPPGKYVLKAWHQRSHMMEKNIIVPATGSVTADITLEAGPQPAAVARQ